jgi:hypothetical protein
MRPTEKLEQRITEAIDGKLSAYEFDALFEELASFPELQTELKEQLKGLPLLTAYTEIQPDPFAIIRLRNQIKSLDQNDWSLDILYIFKRYVLAVGIASLLIVSIMHAIPQQESELDLVNDEITIMFESIETDALNWTPNSSDQQP